MGEFESTLRSCYGPSANPERLAGTHTRRFLEFDHLKKTLHAFVAKGLHALLEKRPGEVA